MSACGGECAKQGHQFMRFAAPQSFACAYCGETVATGRFFHGCTECDRDLCATCFSDPVSRNSEASKEAPKAKAAAFATDVTELRPVRMSYLQVDGPIAPTAPARMSLETLTKLSIPDTNSSAYDLWECEAGAHIFQRFAASIALCCNTCNQQMLPGAYVHSCQECDIDLCGSCFAAEDLSSTRRKVTAPKTAAELHLASLTERCPPQPSPQLPPQLPAQLPISLTKFADIAKGDLVDSENSLFSTQSTEVPSDWSGSSSMLSLSSVSKDNECVACSKPYTGFGATCGDCRKCGPQFRQCGDCKQYFNGFKSLCEECRPQAPDQTVAESPALAVLCM